MFYSFFVSKIGVLFIASNDEFVTNICFIHQISLFLGENLSHYKNFESLPILQAKKWLNDYFLGKKPQISNLPIQPKGTEFQKTIWLQATKIPYGVTLTYGEMAKNVAKLTNKKVISAQAVGTALSKNPILIVIPCHRVIGAKNNLSGYSAGLNIKYQLLNLEQCDKISM